MTHEPSNAGQRTGPVQPPPDWEGTDVQNASLFANHHRHEAKYDTAQGVWRVWDGRRWALDSTGSVVQMAKATLLGIREHAEGLACRRTREQFTKKSLQCERLPRIKAMLELAWPEHDMAVTPDRWNTHPYAFNVLNGTLDLRTGLLKPHEPSDLLTCLAPVQYDPGAECPVFDRFLNEIFAGDLSLIEYMLRVLGMYCSADTREQIFPVLLGEGANGKSTLLEAVMHVMGDYAGTAPPDLLVMKKFEEHPAEIATLVGLRTVVASETDPGRQLRSGLIKQLTGDSRIRTRWMRQDFVQVAREFKIMLMTNHPLLVSEDTEAMARRLRYVRFKVIIPPEKRDRDLPSKLRAEASGILRRLVHGHIDWFENGLREPAAVTLASEVPKGHRHAAGSAARFLEECCDFGEGAWTSSTALNAALDGWAKRSGVNPPTDLDRRTALRGRGCSPVTRKLTEKKERGWLGVSLKAQPDTVDTVEH